MVRGCRGWLGRCLSGLIEDDELGKVLNSGQKVQMEHVPGKCFEFKSKEVVCGEEASDLQLEGGDRIFSRRRGVSL